MKRVEYVTQPFVAEPYRDSGYSRTLAQLMLQRGNQEAAMHLERGDNAARGWQQAGNVINSAVAGWQQNVERKRQMELDAAAEADRRKITGLQIESAELGLNETKRKMQGAETARNLLPLARRESGVYGYDRDLIAREMEAAGYADQLPEVFRSLDEQEAGHFKVIEARRSAIAGDAFRVLQSGAADQETFDNLLEVWAKNDLAPKGDLDMMRKIAKSQGVEAALLGAAQSSPEVAQAIQQMRNANAPDLKAFKPGDVVVDARNPQAGPVLTVPPEEKAPTNIEDAILRARQAGDQASVDELIGMKERMARAGRAPVAAPAAEPLVAITGEDGRPVLVPRSQAVGKAPANTREQGRQVTSGDAGDIAEFNTALDDVAALRETLAGNTATGAAAAVGAALPNAVTELTGWGTDAKQKQAMIDRVRQVIGKALEGGVLRKEDEAKYTKILPTIGDPAAVVATKLNNLEKAIQQRQQRKLDALESAGYDVSRFSAAPADDGWTDVGGFKVRVKP